MASTRLFLILAALSLGIAACSGGGGEVIVPEGEHYTYVSKKAYAPTDNNQAKEYGLDLDNDRLYDNQLGMVLGTLAGMGFDVQKTIDEATAEGSIILLIDFQTRDFTNTTAAGLEVKLGAMPSPAACNAMESYECTEVEPITCMGCGRHLTNGTFQIAAGSPDNAAVAGKIINGTFNGGPGEISLQIALGGTEAIQLDLIGARAKATGISETGIEGVVMGGAITESDLNDQVIPAIQRQIPMLIAEDCTALNMPPACGCMSGSTGKTVLELFDGGIQGTQKDCMVSVEEIKENSLIKSLLAPDVKINGIDALSLGIKVEATKATF